MWSSPSSHLMDGMSNDGLQMETLVELQDHGFEPQTRARSNTWPLPRPDNFVEPCDESESNKCSNQQLSGTEHDNYITWATTALNFANWQLAHKLIPPVMRDHILHFAFEIYLDCCQLSVQHEACPPSDSGSNTIHHLLLSFTLPLSFLGRSVLHVGQCMCTPVLMCNTCIYNTSESSFAMPQVAISCRTFALPNANGPGLRLQFVESSHLKNLFI